MIGFVKGVIDYIAREYVLVDTGGIGYRVFMPASQIGQLQNGQQCKIYTYLAVREDALQLYGFLNRDSYGLFLQLIGVSGIGPKVALGIIAAVKVGEFIYAVQTKDVNYLKQLPGVGKKTAERLLLELKDKLGEAESADVTSSSGLGTGSVGKSALQDAVAALTSLGYTQGEVMPILKGITGYESLSTEDLLKEVLKVMASRQ